MMSSCVLKVLNNILGDVCGACLLSGARSLELRSTLVKTGNVGESHGSYITNYG